MADSKISALPASTTPLAGTEVLPIVQSSATKQVSVANLTAGRAISATQLTLTTGNLIVANGQGVDFSATPNTGSSELLADYEEGTFTATLAPYPGGSGSITLNSSSDVLSYTRIGRLVHVQGLLDVASVSLPVSNNTTLGGLPYITSNSLTENAGRGGGANQFVNLITGAAVKGMFILANDTNANYALDASTIQAGSQVYVSFQYTTDS